MKKIILFFLLSFTSTLFAQHRIALKNGTVLENAILLEQRTSTILFSQTGNEHEIEIEQIVWLEKESAQKWRFINMRLVADNAPDPQTVKVAKDSVHSPSSTNNVSAPVHTIPVTEKSVSQTTVTTGFTKKMKYVNNVPTYYYEYNFIDSLTMTKINTNELYTIGYHDGGELYPSTAPVVFGILSLLLGYISFLVSLFYFFAPITISDKAIPSWLRNNFTYMQGFQEGAKRKKRRSFWKGVLLSLLLAALIIIIALSAATFYY